MFINNYIISILHPVERSLSNVSGLYFASAGQSPVQPLVLLMRRHQFFVSAALYPTWGSAPPRSGIQDSPTGSRAVFLSFFGSVLFLLYSYSSCSISLVLPSSDKKIDWPNIFRQIFCRLQWVTTVMRDLRYWDPVLPAFAKQKYYVYQTQV